MAFETYPLLQKDRMRICIMCFVIYQDTLHYFDNSNSKLDLILTFLDINVLSFFVQKSYSINVWKLDFINGNP